MHILHSKNSQGHIHLFIALGFSIVSLLFSQTLLGHASRQREILESTSEDVELARQKDEALKIVDNFAANSSSRFTAQEATQLNSNSEWFNVIDLCEWGVDIACWQLESITEIEERVIQSASGADVISKPERGVVINVVTGCPKSATGYEDCKKLDQIRRSYQHRTFLSYLLHYDESTLPPNVNANGLVGEEVFFGPNDHISGPVHTNEPDIKSCGATFNDLVEITRSTTLIEYGFDALNPSNFVDTPSGVICSASVFNTALRNSRTLSVWRGDDPPVCFKEDTIGGDASDIPDWMLPASRIAGVKEPVLPLQIKVNARPPNNSRIDIGNLSDGDILFTEGDVVVTGVTRIDPAIGRIGITIVATGDIIIDSQNIENGRTSNDTVFGINSSATTTFTRQGNTHIVDKTTEDGVVALVAGCNIRLAAPKHIIDTTGGIIEDNVDQIKRFQLVSDTGSDDYHRTLLSRVAMLAPSGGFVADAASSRLDSASNSFPPISIHGSMATRYRGFFGTFGNNQSQQTGYSKADWELPEDFPLEEPPWWPRLSDENWVPK